MRLGRQLQAALVGLGSGLGLGLASPNPKQAALDALRSEHKGFDARFAAAQAVPPHTLALNRTLALALTLTRTQP